MGSMPAEGGSGGLPLELAIAMGPAAVDRGLLLSNGSGGRGTLVGVGRLESSSWLLLLIVLPPDWTTRARFLISDNPSLEANEIDRGDVWSSEPTASVE